MLTGLSNPSDINMIEKYCNSDDITKCATYGGLYTWNEAM